MKLVIGVPASWEALATDFVISYTALFRPKQIEALAAEGVVVTGEGIYQQSFGRAFPLDYSRNMIIKGALAMGADALIFLDADMVFQDDTLVRLVRQFKAHPKAGIISGLYFKKAFPYMPVNARWLLNRNQHMFPIEIEQPIVDTDIVGMGCAIIRLEMVKEFPQPWFEYRRDLVRGENAITEDVAFCCKVQEAGWKILTDTSLVCGHLSRQVVDFSSYQLGLVEVEKQREKKDRVESNLIKLAERAEK